jgi:hypothetical protein
VLVLADNLRTSGGLLDEQSIVADVLEGFSRGRRTIHRSVFAYRSTTAVHALLNTNSGAPPAGKPDPASLIPALESCARVQLVKCSPFDGKESKPSDSMTANCPDRYLRSDLALLAPRQMIVLGKPARLALAWMFSIEWREDGGLRRTTLRFASGHSCEVYCLAHPRSQRHWWPAWYAFTQAI